MNHTFARHPHGHDDHSAHGHADHRHGGGRAAAQADAGPSLLRASAASRLALAAGVIAAIWGGVFWAMS